MTHKDYQMVLYEADGTEVSRNTPSSTKAMAERASKQLIRQACRLAFAQRIPVLAKIASGEAAYMSVYTDSQGNRLEVPVFPKPPDMLRAMEILMKAGGLQPRPDDDIPDEDDDETQAQTQQGAQEVADRVIERLEELAQKAAASRRSAFTVAGDRET